MVRDEGTAAVVIRRLRSDDGPAMRVMRLRALATDPLAFGSTWEREVERREAEWQEGTIRGANSPREATWVAEAPDGSLVGMAGLFPREGALHLWGMWVAPEVRRQGIGRGLLAALLDWARSTGSTTEIVLEVNPLQTSAVRLYREAGFEPTGETRPLDHAPGHVVRTMRLRQGGSPREGAGPP